MNQRTDQDFTQLDTFLAHTMAGTFDKFARALNPSRRLASLSRRASS